MSYLVYTYNFDDIPEQLQIGDTGYYSSISTTQGAFTSHTNLIAFGVVSDIDREAIPKTVNFVVDTSDLNNDGIPDITPPSQGDYIMFGKNHTANSSSLIGYYAEAKFVNNSDGKAELFSIGSEISESSK